MKFNIKMALLDIIIAMVTRPRVKVLMVNKLTLCTTEQKKQMHPSDHSNLVTIHSEHVLFNSFYSLENIVIPVLLLQLGNIKFPGKLGNRS